MTTKEKASCILTIELLQKLAFNIRGVMDVVDVENVKKIIKLIEESDTVQYCPNCGAKMENDI